MVLITLLVEPYGLYQLEPTLEFEEFLGGLGLVGLDGSPCLIALLLCEVLEELGEEF